MRMTTRRTRAAATVSAATAALLLAACGAQDVASESPTATPTSTASSPTVDPGPATPTTSSTTPSTSSTPSTTTSESETTTEEPTHTRTRTSTATRTHSQSPTEQPAPAASSTPSAAPSSSAGAGDDAEPSASSSSPSPSSSSSTQPPLSDDDGKTLAMGASGPKVKAAQERLQSLGYFVPAVDGSYGGGTRQAVYAIQKVAGLPRTGEIDKATQGAIDRGVKPQTRISTGIEIDLRRQILVVVQNGRPIKVMNASSGNGQTFTYPVKGDDGKTVTHTAKATTPTGTWTLYNERDELWKSTLELGTMYRPKYITGGIAIHGSPSVPPTPASHGCIRVTNAGMDWLWSSGNAKVGSTKVTVF